MNACKIKREYHLSPWIQNYTFDLDGAATRLIKRGEKRTVVFGQWLSDQEGIRDNPSLSVHEKVRKMLTECGVI